MATVLFLFLELVLRKTPGDSTANGPQETMVFLRAKETTSKTTRYSASEATLARFCITRRTFWSSPLTLVIWLLLPRLLLAWWILVIGLLGIRWLLAIRWLLSVTRLLLSI